MLFYVNDNRDSTLAHDGALEGEAARLVRAGLVIRGTAKQQGFQMLSGDWGQQSASAPCVLTVDIDGDQDVDGRLQKLGPMKGSV